MPLRLSRFFSNRLPLTSSCCALCLLMPLALPAGESTASAPLIKTPQIISQWNAANQETGSLRLWSPGQTSHKQQRQGSSNAYGELRTNVGPLVVTFLADAPLADSVLEVQYRIPEGIQARELHLNIRTPEGGGSKLYTMRLPPAPKGQWHTERVPLADIIGGERWRLGNTRKASSIEIALIATQTRGAPAGIDLRSFAIVREPSPWGELTVPQLLRSDSSGLKRGFEISGTPSRGWLQVIASRPVTIEVNGTVVGEASLKNGHTGEWTHLPLPSAREFPLDGLLKAGENSIVIKPAGESTGGDWDLLAALGYESDGQRHILTSDANWLNNTASATPALAREYRSAVPSGWNSIIDIYPLRNPAAWSAQQPAVKTEVATTTRQPVRFASGSWGMLPPQGEGNSSTHWYLRTPDGKPLYFLGMQTLGLLPDINYRYYRTQLETYGSEADLINDTLAAVEVLGFNGISPAATTTPFHRSAGAHGLYHFLYLGPEAGGPFITNFAGKPQRHMADPFDANWRERYKANARSFARTWGDDPALIGLFVNNEIPLDGAVNGGSIMGYIYSEACRNAFVQWLRERYDSDFAKLQAAWKTELPQIAEISDFDRIPEFNLTPENRQRAATAEEGHASPRRFQQRKGQMSTDLYDFAVYTTEVYANFMLDALREALPGKLIASNRFMGDASDEMLAAWKNYDLIAWNAYPFSAWQAGVYNDIQIERMRRAHEITGKPLLLSEVGLQALDARLPNPSAQLYTQKQRGQEYGRLLEQVYNDMPFVIGFTLFGWQNLSDTERQSWGIIDDRGAPYADYANGVKEANHALKAPK